MGAARHRGGAGLHVLSLKSGRSAVRPALDHSIRPALSWANEPSASYARVPLSDPYDPLLIFDRRRMSHVDRTRVVIVGSSVQADLSVLRGRVPAEEEDVMAPAGIPADGPVRRRPASKLPRLSAAKLSYSTPGTWPEDQV
jgi:hypothetical protein